MKQFDLFSGYGGFAYASNQLGIETIGFSEIDTQAIAVLKYHWPNIKNYGDIQKIDWSNIPNFDLLTGGSPCQDLSIAGKRQGLKGVRSGLFYEYMRAVKEKRPKYFIWENVKGALSSQNGWDFAAVINEMAETGYALWWQVLNAKDFGIPQNRERVFIVGFRDTTSPEIFFDPRDGAKDIRKSESDEKYKDTRKLSDALRIRGIDGASATLKGLGGGMGVKTGLYDVSGLVPMTYWKNSKQKWVKENREYTPAIKAQSDLCRRPLINIGLSHVRRLTPLESERLFGLPDGWTEYGRFYCNGKKCTQQHYDGKPGCVKSISDSQRYKLCGNGVVVDVVSFIIKYLILNQDENAH